MKYTQLPAELTVELNSLKKDSMGNFKSLEHPSYFAHHILGITPYRYQHLILRKFAEDYKGKNDRVIVGKSRQIGLSICVAVLGIWYAVFNKANKGRGTSIYNNTKVGIVSRSEGQARKLMKEIQNMFWNTEKDFQEIYMKKRSSRNPLNRTEIHFKNGWIKCFPPTDACRGETFDLLIIDEAAFVDGELFKDAMEPTVTAVSGKIILSSTPKGQTGFFFELFDPFNKFNLNDREYERFWFYWEMCENAMQKRIIEQKKKFAMETGTMKSFSQEYEADFTADIEAFFDNSDIDNGINPDLVEQYDWKKSPCTVAIDYGSNMSATSITVTTKYKGKIILLFQFAQKSLDENLLMDKTWEHSVPSLMKRYDVQHIVVDNCAMGTRTNKDLENKGYPVVRFDFHGGSDHGNKNRGYYMLRTAIKCGHIKYPRIKPLIYEMKCLQERRLPSGRMQICAPDSAHNDDRCDGLLMGCFPFLDDEGSFSSTVVDYDSIVKKIHDEKKMFDGRFDHDWDKLQHSDNPYDFLFKEVDKNEKKE